MPKRFITRIELTTAARDQLSELCESNGMTQVAVLSRLVQWFAGQPQIIQAGILGHYPAELAVDVAKLILDRMAQNPGGSAALISPPPSAKSTPRK
jgi:hypothetical protein